MESKLRSRVFLTPDCPMTDKWDEHLRCPQCRITGMASLSHLEGAETPIVDFVTAGFKAVQTEYGPDFHCGACNVPVAA